MQFQILIPTYNRSRVLQKNLLYLLGEIKRCQLQSAIGIIVSDNASPDDTFALLNDLIPSFREERIDFKIYRNEQNTGLEGNGAIILGHATAEYVIWLGDDDFLPEGFLEYAVKTFNSEKISWMLTGAIAEYSDGSRAEMYHMQYDEKRFQAGYDTIWEVSHYGHKMSGLVIRREGVLESYQANPQWRNLYLYIYFLLYNQVRYPGIYAAKYKVLVNAYNKKDFDYNTVGLVDEVFKSYNYLIPVYGIKKVIKLLLRFVIIHSYRINFTTGFSSLLKQWKLIYKNYEFGKQLKWGLLRILLKEYVNQNFYLPFRKKVGWKK
jgi:glycosyltransferase involved in cell wall biosynthesis